MNFYRESARIIDQIDSKKGSIKSCLSSVDEKQRKRMAALVIETLKCTDNQDLEKLPLFVDIPTQWQIDRI